MAQKAGKGGSKSSTRSSNTGSGNKAVKGSVVTNKGTKRSTTTTTGSGGPRKK